MSPELTFYQEKLINGILYFLDKRVKYPTITKIFKLLWFADTRNIKQMGVPIFHFTYMTFPYGPVPMEMNIGWKKETKWTAPPEFSSFVEIQNPQENDEAGNVFKPLKKPDLGVFSPFEIEQLDEVILIFKDISPSDISMVTHLRGTAWDKTRKEKGLWKEIDITLAIEDGDEVTRDFALDLVREREENILAFGLD